MDDGGTLPLGVCSEENSRAEDPLKGRDQTAILRTALLHTEGIQHLRSTVESDWGRLLSNGEGREKNRYQPVLAPGQSIARVSGNLQNELTVPPLMKQAARSRHS